MLFQIEAFWSQKTRQIVTMCLIWEPCRGGVSKQHPPLLQTIYFFLSIVWWWFFYQTKVHRICDFIDVWCLECCCFFENLETFKKIAADLITTNISWIYPKYQNTIIHFENVFLGLAWNDTVSKTSITALSP